MMEWKTLRQSKGQTIQSFIEKFQKKSLALNIPLDSYETLMKYIGALHSYIRKAYSREGFHHKGTTLEFIHLCTLSTMIRQ
jgi:hypothetical protein